jgi:low temperature requirement protein LtrA
VAAKGSAIEEILDSSVSTRPRADAPPKRAQEAGSSEWFDLFFDLVFAVAVGLWAERLAHDPTAPGFARSVLLLFPIWWVWLGQTVFAARFPVDPPATRLFALVQVIAVGVMSTELTGDPMQSARYPLAFVAARLALLAEYASMRGVSPEARSIARAYAVGFGAGAAIWAMSVFLPARERAAAWLLGLAVDAAVPWLARPVLRRIPLDHRYVPSRVGVFTSLLLYVAIEGIVRGLSERGWSAWTSAVGLLSFALVVAVWWIYAARVNRDDLRSAFFGSGGQPYLYSHFPIVLGVGALSLGVRLVIEAGGRGDEARSGIAFVSAGLFLWILGIVLIRAVVLHRRDRFWHWPFIAAAVFFPAAAALGATHLPVAALAVFVIVLVALLALEQRHGHPHARVPHRL